MDREKWKKILKKIFWPLIFIISSLLFISGIMAAILATLTPFVNMIELASGGLIPRLIKSLIMLTVGIILILLGFYGVSLSVSRWGGSTHEEKWI